MHLPLDYPTLRIIWWGLMGVLLIGFAARPTVSISAWPASAAVRCQNRRRTPHRRSTPSRRHGKATRCGSILGGGAILRRLAVRSTRSASPAFTSPCSPVLSVVHPASPSGSSKVPSELGGQILSDPPGTGRCSSADSFLPWYSAWPLAMSLLRVPVHRLDTDLRARPMKALSSQPVRLRSPCCAERLSVAMLVLHSAAWLTMKANRARSATVPAGSGPMPRLPASGCSRWA